MDRIRRLFVQKRPGLNPEADRLLIDLQDNLGVVGLRGLRILYRYDVAGLSDRDFARARNTVFSEPPVDEVFEEKFPLSDDETCFGIEYLPGQYDQRADSAAQCLQLITFGRPPLVAAARIIVLQGPMAKGDVDRIIRYCINPVDSRRASPRKPATLQAKIRAPAAVAVLRSFRRLDPAGLSRLAEKLGLAMDREDLAFIQSHFRDAEKRDPTDTEIRLLDTYWSDHCRHTTFRTRLSRVTIEPGRFAEPVDRAYQEYLVGRQVKKNDRGVSLMEIAQHAMKELRRQGKLDDLEVSAEINACSLIVPVDINGREEEWLVMFKNETHNHPTEIEPFGGAATCLGGAIRDPLSGRAYVYQALRLTGSGDPRQPVASTLSGKLPQGKITREATQGFSAYGNQVGLATGQVSEVYDQGYIAKRMEVGAVIGAAPRNQVVRGVPQPGDVVLLVGGRTGRDGIGGATGSSKAHDAKSLQTAGAEVQKGNPVTERKLQRFFRDGAVSRLIKRCNDFGAGGVAVAVGELAEGVTIDLDRIPLKYQGLNGTELALSESQERMAVAVARNDADRFKKLAAKENLEATIVARVTSGRRLHMRWRGQTIADLNRDFLDSSGVEREAVVRIAAPNESDNFFTRLNDTVKAELPDLRRAWLAALADLNSCCQRGLSEQFDASIGAATVLFPFGGQRQATPLEAMVAKVPLLAGETHCGTAMAWGFNPRISRWSPFHGAVYALVDAVVRIVAAGGDHRRVRFSLQEYFEKLGRDPLRWGKPLAALLGAWTAQMRLGLPAVGGKDSMSGSFHDLDVPPTLIAFAVAFVDVRQTVSPEFKKAGSPVVWLPLVRDGHELPDFPRLEKNLALVKRLVDQGNVLAAISVKSHGLAEAISRMAFGNRLGFFFDHRMNPAELFSPGYGSLLLELDAPGAERLLIEREPGIILLGRTQSEPTLVVNSVAIGLDQAEAAWTRPLEKIFPTWLSTPGDAQASCRRSDFITPGLRHAPRPIAKPRALIAVFPGSNCEYDTARAFEKAGAISETLVFRNLTSAALKGSIAELACRLERSQILVIPGGFSAGDEPEGSGKFIAAVLRNAAVRRSVEKLLGRRGGLILGICNGFQALVKVGLLPDGFIHELNADSPTLAVNAIGRHVSRLIRTRVASALSPWFNRCRPGEIHVLPVSHTEGRFVAPLGRAEEFFANGQVATQYVDLDGNPTMAGEFNPNGSLLAIEGLSSPDGRILGKMAHSERVAPYTFINVPGDKDQKLFSSGVDYFR